MAKSFLKVVNIIGFMLFLIAAYFTLFYNLGASPLWVWDEARLANSTLEMMENANLIVPHYNGKPDMWSTKPPFLIWIQCISASIFGLNVWALRLPSALAGLLTAGALWWFCSKILYKHWMGFFSAILLVSLAGFAGEHVTRSADYDAMLILFTTGYLLLFYIYAITHRNKYLYLAAVAVTLAILTKGIAAILFLPFIGIWLLANKQVAGIFKNKHLYISLSIVLVLGLGYYFLRETLNSGYIQAVANNELGGRFNNAVEGHTGEWWFYLNVLYKKGVYQSLLFVIPGLIALFRSDSLKKLASYLFICIIGYTLVVSSAGTKLDWYIAPVYPLLAMLAGYGMYIIIKYTFSINKIAGGVVTASILIFIVGTAQYAFIENKPRTIHNESGSVLFGKYMQALPDYYRNYSLVSDMSVNAHTAFYSKLYNKQGYNLKQATVAEVQVGDTLMLCERSTIIKVREKFTYNMLDSGINCILVKIKNTN